MRRKKRNTWVYIDGENVPERKYGAIKEAVSQIGVRDCSKVYGLKNDKSTKAWTECSRKEKGLRDVRLKGKPEKNKVDRKIKKDIRRDIRENKGMDVIVIVSSDKGFRDIVEEGRKAGKKVVVIGEEKTAGKLREACSEFWEI